jgi:gluconate kinase
MAELVVVSGPPGAGKSTVARLLAGQFERSVLVEGDAFFGFLARGAIEPWLSAANDQNDVVIQAAAAAAGRFAAGGFVTVYEGVVGPWFLDRFVQLADLPEVHYAILMPSLDQCLDRVTSRTGHGFTDQAATRHMYQQFADAVIDQRHVFANAPGTATQTVRDILHSMRSGALLTAGVIGRESKSRRCR